MRERERERERECVCVCVIIAEKHVCSEDPSLIAEKTALRDLPVANILKVTAKGSII